MDRKNGVLEALDARSGLEVGGRPWPGEVGAVALHGARADAEGLDAREEDPPPGFRG